MKLTKIRHKDGSFSLIQGNVTLVKNKESIEDQVMEKEIDVPDIVKAFEEEKKKEI